MGIFKDLTGQISGTLVAKEYLGNSKWLCVCQVCKNEVVIATEWFNRNKKLGRDGCKHSKQINIGDIFGYLTVLERADDYIKPKSKAHEPQWLCKCDCGREKKILESNLKSYKSLSCGKCMTRVSVPEKMIFYYLSMYFDDIEEQYRPNWLNGKEIDVFLPSLQVGIEYDGERWHKDIANDLEKDEICKVHGITIIHVREPKCTEISKFKYCVITPKPTTNGTHMTRPIQEIIEILNLDYSCNINLDVDCLRDNADICKAVFTTSGFNSLAYLYPEIAEEWDFAKNYPSTPDRIPARSGKKAYWICPKCNHSYSSVIASRTSKDRCGCPKCKNKKEVKCVELNIVFESVKDASKYVNRKPCSISSAISKKTTCGGYHWEFAEKKNV